MKEFKLEDDEILIYYMLALLILKDIAKNEKVKVNVDEFLDGIEKLNEDNWDLNGILNDLKELVQDSISSLKQLDDPPPMFLNMYDFLNDFLNFSRGKKLEAAFKELGLKPERLQDLFDELNLEIMDDRVKAFFDIFEISDRYEELIKWLNG